jgi:hypothetical protein
MRDRALSIFHNVDDVPEPLQNKLMSRAMAYPDLSTFYLDTLAACANSAGELVENDPRGWMEREVDLEYEQIRDAALNDPEKSYTNDQFNQAIEDLRKFAHDRFDFVRTAVANKR